MRLWRLGSRGFTLARRVGALHAVQRQPIGGADSDSSIGIDVDLAGRLHVGWGIGKRLCGGQNCVVYRRTDRRGLGAPVVYPAGRRVILDTPRRVIPAANSGGSGWMVWTGGDNARAVPLVAPPRGSRVGSRRIGRRRVSIRDFYGCVPTGGVFRHRLDVDGRREVRIVKVRFFFDAGQPAATDRRSPFRHAFRLSFPSGSRHVAGAKVSYRLPGSKRVRTLRIGRTFVMC